MRAFIQFNDGRPTLCADYNQRRQCWELDHGCDDVRVSAEQSGFESLRQAFPDARVIDRNALAAEQKRFEDAIIEPV